MISFEQARMTTGVVLIEFYASWCPHCRRMMPIVAEVKELLGEQVPVYQYDIDEYPRDAEEAGATSVPTFIIYRNGMEMWRTSGEISGDELMARVEDALS